MSVRRIRRACAILQEPEALADLLARVIDARDAAPIRRPLLLKIAPDLTLAQLDAIVRVARDGASTA